MKKITLILLLLASTSAFAQKIANSRVPAPVKSAFSKAFPGIKEMKWEKEKDNYEATFKAEGQKTSATFEKNGNWVETERVIPVISLPAEATAYIERNFNGKIARSASVIAMAGGTTTYEAHIKGQDYIFDADGKFVRIEKD